MKQSDAHKREIAPRVVGKSAGLLSIWRLKSDVVGSGLATFAVGTSGNSDGSLTPARTSDGPTTSTTTTTTTTSQNSQGATSFLQGVYVGPADPAGVKTFAAATSTDVSIASDYLPASSGWSGMDGEDGSIGWLTNAWQNSGYTLSLGVPMIPTNSLGQPQGSLALGASGSYNGYFTTLANTLVAAGDGDAYLRLGWEFDGNWYAWQAQNPVAEAEYVAYFRQIVNAMRSVAGAEFKFVWNPDAGAFTEAGYSVKSAYPGNAYVDVIGLDLYDMSWATPSTPQNAWMSTYLPELSAAESFAQMEGKPIAFCEWGALIRPADHGMGDDPYYISNMLDWMKTHDVNYESYFEGVTSDTGSSVNQNLLGPDFPNSLAAFIAQLS